MCIFVPKNYLKMKKKLFLLLGFVVLGILQAVIFMLVYSARFEPYSFAQCLLALIYSVPQSLMVASWVMLLPFFLGFVYVWIRGDWHRRFMIWYVTIVAIPLLLLHFFDWEMYGTWGCRLDVVPLSYLLSEPWEAIKQADWWSLLLDSALTAFFVWLLYHVMQWVYPRRRSGSITRMNTGAAQQREGLMNLLLTILMLVVGNGCFGLMSISSSYHTDQQPLNHAAISPVYNLFHSWRQSNSPLDEEDLFLSDEDRDDAFAELLFSADVFGTSSYDLDDPVRVKANQMDSIARLVSPHTNVVLITLDGFSASACSYLNPEADEQVMPNVCHAMSEGIAFTQCYANSSFAEGGMSSILHAIPVLPFSFGRMQDLQDSQSQNLASLIMSIGFSYESLMGESHDFDTLLSRLQTESALAQDTLAEYPAQPYFKIFSTRHVSALAQESARRQENPYLTSVAYVDSCLGAFLDAVRADTMIWNNLLVIGVSDYAYSDEINGPMLHDPNRYHIPMFWTGGAVAGHADVDRYCQQSDLAITLLHRLHFGVDGFQFSNDVFKVSDPHIAFYSWPDGFGFLTDSCKYIQDNHYDGHALPGSNDPSGWAERVGKAYLQTIYPFLEP